MKSYDEYEIDSESEIIESSGMNIEIRYPSDMHEKESFKHSPPILSRKNEDCNLKVRPKTSIQRVYSNGADKVRPSTSMDKKCIDKNIPNLEKRKISASIPHSVNLMQSPSERRSSKKQGTVAKSSTEAEYVALSLATQESIWLRRLLESIRHATAYPTVIYEDNQGAIEISKNPKYQNHTKHIDVSFHFTHERVSSKEITVIYCPTSDMIADVMMKAPGRVQFQKTKGSP